jgi:WD40 repeat protein
MHPLPTPYRGDPALASGGLLIVIDPFEPVKFWDATGRRGLGEVALRRPADARPTLGGGMIYRTGGGQSTIHCISMDGRWAVGDGCAWDLSPCLDALSAGAGLVKPRPIFLPGEEGERWYPVTLSGEFLLRIREGVCEVWALSSERLAGRFVFGAGTPWTALLAGGLAYTSPRSRTLTVTDIATGGRVAALEHTQTVRAVCLSPDGRFLVTAAGVTVRVWDANTFELLHRFKGVGRGSLEMNPLAFHPSGRFFAVCCRDETVRYWTADGGELARYAWGEGWLCNVVFSPDGMLAAARNRGSSSVVVWDVDI